MAIKCNNKTHVYLQAAAYFFFFGMLDVLKKSTCRYWWIMANTHTHKNYRPHSLSSKTIIQHSVKLKYFTHSSSRTRRNSKLIYPDILIRLCGNNRIPVFHIIWIEKGRPISWPPHSSIIVILISFWELSCKVRRESLKTVNGSTVWSLLTWRKFSWSPRIITY
jgi:hypothetical protein